MLYRLYVQDLAEFEKLYAQSGGWAEFLACAGTLEKEKDPEDALKKLNERLKASNERSCSESKHTTK